MRKFLAAVVLGLCCLGVRAAVVVDSPWVRGTVEGQQASGAFMTITSSSDAILVGISTPIAAAAELHQMTLENGIMKMRPAPRLDLPAGKAVSLKPGGYHVMLMGLKGALKPGDSVPITLRVEHPDKRIEKVELKAAVRDPGSMPPQMEHHH